MTVLIDVMWLTIGAAMAGWAAMCVWPRIGDDLEHIADAYLRWRRRTELDRLARRARRREHV